MIPITHHYNEATELDDGKVRVTIAVMNWYYQSYLESERFVNFHRNQDKNFKNLEAGADREAKEQRCL
ncbi:hypothetical protein STEG23_017808 [Scotinomys teguina]